VKRFLLWSSLAIGVAALIVIVVTTRLYTGVRSDTPFVEAHERAVRSFVKSEGFGISRLRRKDLWNEHSVLFENARCMPWAINLIGLTADNGKRYFENARPPKKKEIPTAAHRELAEIELAAVETIQSRDTPFAKLPASKEYQDLRLIRVIAPIRALQDCLECHTGKVGDVLGAFDYHLLAEVSTEKPR
jgi:hypothetical protein